MSVEVLRDGERYELSVSAGSEAPREVVYELLADLRQHMAWGGSWHPSRTQRLLSMTAPDGPATRGVEFRSVGATPAGSWHDRSIVTQSDPPSVFEFHTDGSFRGADQLETMTLIATHRYELEANEGGTQILYRFQGRIVLRSPPGKEHPRLPAVVFNLIVPSVVERGTLNLARMAEEVAFERPGPARAEGTGADAS